ncbi:hypothetical protein [Clostridium ganghwense]|uniref:Uncharacterized protein n=1 Tax=Clostridium ganghwense TaxID=312089 RepID=A0ABT4CT44_9CLOT|nr:hypothetical protein [Clostridium ganghwense]MCY6371366.1 hypothetical protein [Clostridium ganghwense]
MRREIRKKNKKKKRKNLTLKSLSVLTSALMITSAFMVNNKCYSYYANSFSATGKVSTAENGDFICDEDIEYLKHETDCIALFKKDGDRLIDSDRKGQPIGDYGPVHCIKFNIEPLFSNTDGRIIEFETNSKYLIVGYNNNKIQYHKKLYNKQAIFSIGQGYYREKCHGYYRIPIEFNNVPTFMGEVESKKKGYEWDGNNLIIYKRHLVNCGEWWWPDYRWFTKIYMYENLPTQINITALNGFVSIPVYLDHNVWKEEFCKGLKPLNDNNSMAFYADEYIASMEELKVKLDNKVKNLESEKKQLNNQLGTLQANQNKQNLNRSMMTLYSMPQTNLESNSKVLSQKDLVENTEIMKEFESYKLTEEQKKLIVSQGDMTLEEINQLENEIEKLMKQVNSLNGEIKDIKALIEALKVMEPTEEIDKEFNGTLDEKQVEAINKIAQGYINYVLNLEKKKKNLNDEVDGLISKKKELQEQLSSANKEKLNKNEAEQTSIKDINLYDKSKAMLEEVGLNNNAIEEEFKIFELTKEQASSIESVAKGYLEYVSELQGDIKDLTNEANKLNSEIEKIEAIEASVGEVEDIQPVEGEEVVEKFNGTLSEQQIKEIKKIDEKYIDYASALEKSKGNLTEKIDAANAEREELKSKLDQLKVKKLDKTEITAESGGSSIEIPNKIELEDDQVNKINDVAEGYVEYVSQLESEVSDLNNKLEEVNSEIKSIKEEIEKLSNKEQNETEEQIPQQPAGQPGDTGEQGSEENQGQTGETEDQEGSEGNQEQSDETEDQEGSEGNQEQSGETEDQEGSEGNQEQSGETENQEGSEENQDQTGEAEDQEGSEENQDQTGEAEDQEGSEGNQDQIGEKEDQKGSEDKQDQTDETEGQEGSEDKQDQTDEAQDQEGSEGNQDQTGETEDQEGSEGNQEQSGETEDQEGSEDNQDQTVETEDQKDLEGNQDQTGKIEDQEGSEVKEKEESKTNEQDSVVKKDEVADTEEESHEQDSDKKVSKESNSANYTAVNDDANKPRIKE